MKELNIFFIHKKAVYNIALKVKEFLIESFIFCAV